MSNFDLLPESLIKSQLCSVLVNGKAMRGEYTGYSNVTHLHYVSLYNGSVVKLVSMSKITFD